MEFNSSSTSLTESTQIHCVWGYLIWVFFFFQKKDLLEARQWMADLVKDVFYLIRALKLPYGHNAFYLPYVWSKVLFYIHIMHNVHFSSLLVPVRFFFFGAFPLTYSETLESIRSESCRRIFFFFFFYCKTAFLSCLTSTVFLKLISL